MNMLTLPLAFLVGSSSFDLGGSSPISIKTVLLTLLLLAGIGFLAFGTTKIPAPDWLKWCIYAVLGLAAFFIVYRFIQMI